MDKTLCDRIYDALCKTHETYRDIKVNLIFIPFKLQAEFYNCAKFMSITKKVNFCGIPVEFRRIDEIEFCIENRGRVKIPLVKEAD